MYPRRTQTRAVRAVNRQSSSSARRAPARSGASSRPRQTRSLNRYPNYRSRYLAPALGVMGGVAGAYL